MSKGYTETFHICNLFGILQYNVYFKSLGSYEFSITTYRFLGKNMERQDILALVIVWTRPMVWLLGESVTGI